MKWWRPLFKLIRSITFVRLPLFLQRAGNSKPGIARRKPTAES
jgi:hypothetical protein